MATSDTDGMPPVPTLPSSPPLFAPPPGTTGTTRTRRDETGTIRTRHTDTPDGGWCGVEQAAKQRAGRAGRTGPGICLRLYSQKRMDTEFPDETVRAARRIALFLFCFARPRRDVDEDSDRLRLALRGSASGDTLCWPRAGTRLVTPRWVAPCAGGRCVRKMVVAMCAECLVAGDEGCGSCCEAHRNDILILTCWLVKFSQKYSPAR